MKNRILFIGISLLIAVCTTSFIPLIQTDQTSEATDPVQTELLPVESSNASGTAVAEAKLWPKEDVSLGFQSNGVIVNLSVKEGDTVKKGDVLAELKGTEEFDLAYAKAELDLLQAEKDLKALQDSYEKTKAVVSLRVIQAKTALDDANKTYDTFDTPEYRKKLDDANKAAKDKYSEVEDAQDVVDDVADLDVTSDRRITAEDDYKKIRQDYDKLERDYNLLLNDRDKADADVIGAETELADAERELEELADGPKQTDLNILNQRIATAKAEQTSATVNKELMKLIAPFDGEIVSVNVSEGEIVPPGAVVLVMVDPSEMILKTVDLSETDMALVKEGDSVTVEFDAYPAELLRGKVTKITNWGDKYLGDVVYPVEVTLDRTSLPVLWGMTASVYFE